MLKKLVKIFTSLIFLILSLYLLFPWWIGWLIKLNLPNNISLQTIESGYPGISQLHIDKIVVDIDGARIALHRLNLDYSFANIKVDEAKASLSLAGEDNSRSKEKFDINNVELTRLALPYIDFEQLDILESIKIINIDKFTLNIDQNNHLVTSIKLTQPNKKQFNINVQEIKYINNLNKEKELDLNAVFQVDALNKTANLKASFYQQPFIELDYYHTKTKTAFNIVLDVNSIKQMIPEQFLTFLIDLKDETRIQWVEDSLNKQTNITLNSQLIINKKITELLKNNEIDLRVLDSKKHEEILIVPIELAIVSDNNKESLNADITLTTSVVENISLSRQKSSVNVESIQLELSSFFEVFYNELQDKQVQFTNNKIKISSPKIMIQDKALNYHINADQVSFDGTVSAIKSSLDNPITSRLNNSWSLDGKLTASSLNANYKNEKIQSNANFKSEFKIRQLNLNQDTAFVSNGKLTLSGLNILTDTIELNGEALIHWSDLDSKFSKGQLSASLDTVDNKVSNMVFESLTSKAEIVLNKEEIKGDVELDINQQRLAPSTFVFNKLSRKLSMNFVHHQINQMLPNYFLTKIGHLNKIPLKIVSANVRHSGNLELNSQLDMLSQLIIKDMLFQFGENEIQGFSITQAMTSFDPLVLSAELSVEKVNFSSGLVINQLTTKVVTQNNNEKSEVIDAINLHAKLLEGELKAKSIRYYKGEILPSEVLLKQLSLTELIFFMDIAGLYAEGEINLVLPISTDSGRFVINNGRFNAVGEGIIKYSSGSVDQSEEENIAIKALKNFHYKSLDGTLSYNNQGAYQIKLHLLGSNPDVYNGYPIDFVLNLNGELSGVFRSLFLTGNFEEAVMQQVKSDQLEKKENK